MAFHRLPLTGFTKWEIEDLPKKISIAFVGRKFPWIKPFLFVLRFGFRLSIYKSLVGLPCDI